MKARDRRAELELADLEAEVAATRLPPVSERSQIRSRAGVSIRRAAAAIDVSPMSISRWERGEATPRADNARLYVRLLETLQEAVRV